MFTSLALRSPLHLHCCLGGRRFREAAKPRINCNSRRLDFSDGHDVLQGDLGSRWVSLSSQSLEDSVDADIDWQDTLSFASIHKQRIGTRREPVSASEFPLCYCVRSCLPQTMRSTSYPRAPRMPSIPSTSASASLRQGGSRWAW